MQDTRALHLTDLIIPARAFGATLRGSGARFSLICTAGAERLWLSMTVIRSLSASRMVSGAFAEEVDAETIRANPVVARESCRRPAAVNGTAGVGATGRPALAGAS